MSRVNPLFTAIAVLGLVALAGLSGPRQRATDRRSPMTGVLYSIDADSSTSRTGGSSDDLPLPELRVGLDQSARENLPPGLDFIVHLVPAGGTQLRLTSSQEAASAPKLGTAPIMPNPKVRGQHARARHEHRKAITPQERPSSVPIAAAAPVAAPPAAPTPPTASVQPPVPTPPAAPTPTQAKTFGELDDALRSSPLTQTLNLRLRLDEISFRITHVGRVGNREAVRFAIANSGGGDFFVSIVNVSTGAKPIHSETAGPYSCASGQEVFGIAHFAAEIAAGKIIAVELVQSGGEHRRFALKLPIPF